ncbi:MAG: SET domain-containing protein [Geminicoccaceae bacterium]
MDEVSTSYLLPSLEVRWISSKERYGVFALLPVPAGTVLAVWGGWVMGASQFLRLPPERRRAGIQVEEGLFLVAPSSEPAEHFNHSCAPKAAMSGQIALVARCHIEAGEEVCMDYAMCDGLAYDEFDCDCDAPACRGRVSAEDWRRPELWARYPGGFSPFLQRRIDRLSAELVGSD